MKNGKNKNGYTPQQLANINENQEIIDLFPIVEKKYEVPYSYTSYNNFINLAPEIFEGTDM